MNSPEIARQIREFRESLGLNIKEFYKKTGVSHICNIERNVYGLGPRTGARLIKAFPELNTGAIGKMMADAKEKKLYVKKAKDIDTRTLIKCPKCGGEMAIVGNIACCTVEDKIVGKKRIRGCSAVGIYSDGKVVLG